MRRASVAVAVGVVVALGSMTPAHAASVEVDLRFTTGPTIPIAYLGVIELKACSVRVHARADGFDILRAAVAQGCIDSYDTWQKPGYYGGTYVSCIDDLCHVVAPVPWPLGAGGAFELTHWWVRENDSNPYATGGLARLKADAGDVFSFGYTHAMWA